MSHFPVLNGGLDRSFAALVGQPATGHSEHAISGGLGVVVLIGFVLFFGLLIIGILAFLAFKGRARRFSLIAKARVLAASSGGPLPEWCSHDNQALLNSGLLWGAMEVWYQQAAGQALDPQPFVDTQERASNTDTQGADAGPEVTQPHTHAPGGHGAA